MEWANVHIAGQLGRSIRGCKKKETDNSVFLLPTNHLHYQFYMLNWLSKFFETLFRLERIYVLVMIVILIHLNQYYLYYHLSLTVRCKPFQYSYPIIFIQCNNILHIFSNLSSIRYFSFSLQLFKYLIFLSNHQSDFKIFTQSTISDILIICFTQIFSFLSLLIHTQYVIKL